MLEYKNAGIKYQRVDVSHYELGGRIHNQIWSTRDLRLKDFYSNILGFQLARLLIDVFILEVNAWAMEMPLRRLSHSAASVLGRALCVAAHRLCASYTLSYNQLSLF